MHKSQQTMIAKIKQMLLDNQFAQKKEIVEAAEKEAERMETQAMEDD